MCYFVLMITSSFFFLKNLFIYLIFACVFFVAACRFSLVVVSRGYSLLQCTGFSLRWLLLLQSMGSRHTGLSSCGLLAVERRLSSCGTWAQLLRSMWDLPSPGLEPMSPALAGGFLTTSPPGEPTSSFLTLQNNLRDSIQRSIAINRTGKFT